MAGFIQNTVNNAIRASASLAKGVKSYARQIGKNPSAEAKGAQVGAAASPMSSEMAAEVARKNLTDKRNSNKMTKQAIHKFGVLSKALSSDEPPAPEAPKAGKEPKHVGK